MPSCACGAAHEGAQKARKGAHPHRRLMRVRASPFRRLWQPSFAEALKASHGETPTENKSNVVAKLNHINRRWDYSGDPELARIAAMSGDGHVEAVPVVANNAKVPANGKGSPGKGNGVDAAAPAPASSASALAPVVTFAIDGSERLVPCNVLPSCAPSPARGHVLRVTLPRLPLRRLRRWQRRPLLPPSLLP